MSTVPHRRIRARFDDESITVYQAYSPAIASPAVAAGRFCPPFRMDRMTWIKPSFLWMMYRCGWAQKPGQERVLAIRISREGFESALTLSCLSHFDKTMHPTYDQWRADLANTPIRIQWDPERDRSGQSLDHRSLQIGLSGPAVRQYVNEWTLSIDDITNDLPAIRTGDRPLPQERPYPLPKPIATRIGATTA